jgi:GMP synthase PP-ATPase subunit
MTAVLSLSHVLVLNPPSSLELLMPFFQGSNDVSVHGGKFTDVKGDWTIYDHSQHVRHINSHNTDTTNVIDSNNDSSVHTYIESKLVSRICQEIGALIILSHSGRST